MTIQLTKLQLFLLMFVMQTGFVYTAVENLIIEHGKRDATIQFLIVASVFFLQLLFFERMHKYFVLGRFMKVIYLIYWFIYLIVFVVYIAYVLTTWAFPNTPHFVFITIFLLVCFYASISRPETAINIGVMLLPMFVLFIIFMLLTIPNLQVTNLLPLFHDRKDSWGMGVLYSIYAFGGAEMYIILRKYVINNESISKKVLTAYYVILTFFYLLAILITLMYFSLDEIAIIPEPIFYILHSLELTFIKRLDIFFVIIWLSWSLVAIVNYVLVMRIFYFEKKRKAPVLQQFVFFAIICLIANALVDFSILEFFKHYLVYGVIVFTFFVPIMIVLVNKIRGRTVSESDTSS